jgi:DNA polymerase-3 subunit gamma/tau
VKLVDILGELRGIAEREGVDADEAALSLLAEAGDGSMRDALSIMDQAIASAPVQDGRPVLDASQIRELMGTVPNAVFEKILEAVDGNRSAEVITVANQLLDAGNSPAQLARQFVRYLRNCVIAKIAGIGSDGSDANGVSGELLQISADEQRRAGRSAALFGEEELTRFLQVMLRTFDELGYRQEQRFHFELGLLKLVHLRRLLPIEEVLSQFPVGRNAGQPQTQGAASQARVAAPSPAANRVMNAPVPPAVTKPAFSPFEADKGRKRFESGEAEKPVAAAPVPIAAKPIEPAPIVIESLAAAAVPVSTPATEKVAPSVKEVAPRPAITPIVQAAPEPSEVEVAPARVEAPIAEPVPAASSPSQSSQEAAELQRVAIEALTNAKSQGSATDALADADWTVEGSELRVQTELSKTMLPMVVNPEAEKIVRAALREVGAGALKLMLLPGTATAAAAKKPRAAKSGSAQAKAMEHPIVQQAQKLFDAEIRNVIDLREGD